MSLDADREGILVKPMRFDVFGRAVAIERAGDRWSVYYLGTEGKRRPARDIVVPSDRPASEIERCLADLCHEWATRRHPSVRRLS